MQRVEIRGAILYVERSRGWSLLLFGVISGSLIAASASGAVHDRLFKAATMSGGITLGVAAILLAFKARVFVIRLLDRRLEIVTRIFPGFNRKESYALAATRAVLKTRTLRTQRRMQQVWLEVRNGPSWTLGPDYLESSGEKPAEQLAKDLGSTLVRLN